MDEFTKISVDDFLDRVAERSPTPGGGSVTGVAGALACTLARMVAAYSVRKDTEPSAREAIDRAASRLRRADQIIRALISRDAAAYTKMTAAAKAWRASDRKDPEAEAAYRDAVMEATAVPMEMAAVASNALADMDEFKSFASLYLLSDLAIAAVLADATARSARCTMWVNTREISDAETRLRLSANIDRVMLHCASHLASIEAFVHRHLAEGDGTSR